MNLRETQGNSTTTPLWEGSDLGETAIVPMKNAPYPHSSREKGYDAEDGKFYPKEPHYVDSSVALFIPRGYRPTEETDVVVYFHGHRKNIRLAFEEFRIREHLLNSGKNAILVFPEGPKDSPDSGAGQIEEPNAIKHLLKEALDVLLNEGKIQTKRLGKVILSGHSGAYRANSFILEHGGIEDHIREVLLLDSSYQRLEQFVNWVSRNKQGRLLSIFTDHLAKTNVWMMTRMRRNGDSYLLVDFEDVTDSLLLENRIVFIYTNTLDHDQTVQCLEPWLRTGCLQSRSD